MYRTQDPKESFTAAIRKLFANPSFVILLTTAWIRMGIYEALQPFGNLFLRDVGISYTNIGLLNLVYSLVIIIACLIGSYYSDLLPHRRSKFSAAHNIFWGIMCLFFSLTTGFWSALVVYVIAGVSWAFQPAARAYLLEHSGEQNHHFAMGFFSIYRLPLLFMFLFLLWLFKIYGFVLGIRIALVFTGSIIIVMGLVRWMFLKDPPNKNTHKDLPSLSGIVKNNAQTLRFILKIAPAFCLITCIDGMSDQLYSFLIFFFLNENAGLSETELLAGRITLDVLSIPLILWLAFRINRSNGRRTFFLLYLIPCVTVGLLLVSLSHSVVPFVPNYFPVAFKKLAFLAYSMKYVSDFLWMLMLAPIAIKFVSRENVTKAIGISWLLVHISRLVAAPFAGGLYQQDNITAILLSILALNCVILALILTLDCEFNDKTKSLILND